MGFPREEPEGEDLGDVVVLAKGPRALLLGFQDLGKKHWVPFSQFHDNSDVHESNDIGDTGNCVISRWLADKEDFQKTDDWDEWEDQVD